MKVLITDITMVNQQLSFSVTYLGVYQKALSSPRIVKESSFFFFLFKAALDFHKKLKKNLSL